MTKEIVMYNYVSEKKVIPPEVPQEILQGHFEEKRKENTN